MQWTTVTTSIIYVLSLARPDEDEKVMWAQPGDAVLSPLTLEELLSKQKTDKFFQEVLARQSTMKDSKFF